MRKDLMLKTDMGTTVCHHFLRQKKKVIALRWPSTFVPLEDLSALNYFPFFLSCRSLDLIGYQLNALIEFVAVVAHDFDGSP